MTKHISIWAEGSGQDLPSASTYTTHSLECDLLVAGGGMAGVCCAIAAARQGARVVLCQDRPVLGGNASSEIRMHVVGANTARPCEHLVLEARESGIIEEIRLENAYRNPQRSPSMFDLILYEKVRAQANITLLLNTCVVASGTSTAACGRTQIDWVEALRVSTEDRFRIRARAFADCTGDGALGVAAGAAFFRGREEKEQYGESLAQVQADTKTLGSTILFMARKHDRPMPFIAPPWARKFTEADLVLRPHATDGIDYGLEYGYWWIEWGGQLDTIKDGELIRDELLAIVMGVWDHIKNTPGHGAENWALDWVGAVPGKRESRRFAGQYVLTQNDVLSGAVFADSIAYGGWPIDEHPPEGVDAPDQPPCHHEQVPYLYAVPLRSCLARDFTNLMFAGRNISASHVAFASTRVMATCALMGEGIGVAAAYAMSEGIAPADLPAAAHHLKAVQQRLLLEDVYLIGECVDESSNLALRAKISASSAREDCPAQNVVSGVNRSVTAERGVRPEHSTQGTHRWIAAHGSSLPQVLQLDWQSPVSISGVDVVFDSGLHRHLTLTHSDAYAQQMHWGQGQPEMVRDFYIEVTPADPAARPLRLASSTDNWQRRWSHALPEAIQIRSLKLVVTRMWQEDALASIVRLAVR